MSDDQNKINLDNIAGSLGENINKEETKDKVNGEARESALGQEVKPENNPESQPKNEIETPIENKVEPAAPVAPAEPEDIFSDTELERPAVLQPKAPETEMNYEPAPSNSRKLIILVGVLLTLVVIVIGVYFSYNYFFNSDISTGEENVMTEEINPIEESSGDENANINVNQLVNNVDVNEDNLAIEPVDISSQGVPEDEIDTDGDGLSDKDEIVRGMNIESNDSDNDGLYDREEVMVYNTDPTNPDTDGDGFSDGDEVDAGYNPKGAGKLYDLTGVK